MLNNNIIFVLIIILCFVIIYKKNELISMINVIKSYPLVQINAALNQLVEDKNEFISDKYGRIGNLPGEYSKKKYSDLKIKGVRGVGKIAKPNIDHEAMCVVILDHYLDGDIEAEGVPCSCVEHYSNLSDLTIRENIKLLQHLMQCPMKGPPNL